MYILLTDEIQLSKSEDVIGYIQQLISQAASHLARRKACIEWKTYRQKEAGQGSYSNRVDCFRQDYLPTRESRGLPGGLLY